MEIFFAEKNIDLKLFNKIFEYKIYNLQKIYELEKHALDKDYFKELSHFRKAIQDKYHLIYFLNLKNNYKNISIGFFHHKKFSERDFTSYKFIKDKKALIFFSGNKFIFADDGKDAQFFFSDSYFFIIGFHNGGGFYLRNQTLNINIKKLSNQFLINKNDLNFLKEFSEKNLYEYLDSIQVFKINFY